MKNRRFLISALTILLSFSSLNCSAEKLIIAAEEYPPYVFLNKNLVDGFSAHVVSKALKIAGVAQSIEIYPFARSKLLAEKRRPIITFPVVKSPDRNETFDWLGTIAQDKLYLFKLGARKDIDVSHLSDAMHLSISAIRGGIIEHYLKTKDHNNFIPVTDIEQGINLLHIGRTDLLASTQLTLNYFSHKLDYSKQEIQPVLALEELSIEAHLAASISVARETREKIRNALHHIHESGEFSKLKQNFLSNIN